MEMVVITLVLCFLFINTVKLSSFPAMCSARASAERLFPASSNA